MEVRKNTTMDTSDNHHHHHHRNHRHDPAFWLPSNFLTDDNNDDDRQYLLAQLTRQLARNSLHHNSNPPHTPTEQKEPWRLSTSPQSTLSGVGPWSGRSGFTRNGSPNGTSRVPSPPLTPPGDKSRDVDWELLYEAAGEVARIKMEAMAAQLNLHHHHHHHHQNRGLNSSLPTNQYPQLKRQGYSQHNHQQQSAWPPLRPVRHQSSVRGGSDMRTVYLRSGSVHTSMPPVKRQSTGTGVFIPQSQRIGSQPEPSRKKPTGCSTVLLPARVVQALNLDLDEINNNGVNRNSQSYYTSGFLTDQDVLMARRNALLSQQKRNMKTEGGATMAGVGGIGNDIRLPTDWTY